VNEEARQEPPDYFVGLDLGQQQDPTALVVLERRRRPAPGPDRKDALQVNHFSLVHLRRWHLGTKYTAIVDDVCELVRTPPLSYPQLVIDQTGVGKAVVDQFERAVWDGKLRAYMRPVLITAGHQIDPSADDGSIHVPKKELVSCLQVLLQSGRLKIAPVPHREVLVKELANFKVKITVAANETFEAWREREHDDLVLATCLAAWHGERCFPWEPARSVESGETDRHGRSRAERRRMLDRFLGR
jgi:hypothetical protein